MKILESEIEFNDNITDGITLADFAASWCVPCKQIIPTLEKLEKEFQDIKFLKIDVEIFYNISNSYNITSVPTLMIFKNNNVVCQISGLQDYKKIRSLLESAQNT